MILVILILKTTKER